MLRWQNKLLKWIRLYVFLDRWTVFSLIYNKFWFYLLEHHRCFACHQKCPNATEAVQHSLKHHPESPLIILRPISEDSNHYRKVNFNINISNLKCNITDIKVKTPDYILSFPDNSPSTSPHRKITKPDPPCTLAEARDHAPICIDKDNPTTIKVEQMIELLPSVAEQIGNKSDIEQWLQFFQLIKSGDFPQDNIAYQLFLDVILFYSTQNIHAMQYSDSSKQFWALGMRLFKSKFIRFMLSESIISCDIL